MSKERTKLISEVDTGENVVSVREPFELKKNGNRRYIRLEISDPIGCSVLKDRSGGFWPEGEGPVYHASLLNLSAGGILIDCDSPMEDGTLVIMSLTLQGVELIDHIIGIVKRCEPDEDSNLIGIEFIPRENLTDFFSTIEYEAISSNLTSFDERLRRVLNKYVYYKRVAAEG
nr:PilZ domain-containing protein [candidate division Zixibacteria bacterium]